MYGRDSEQAFNAAVNILAVEYLIKTVNEHEYSKRIEQLRKLDSSDLESLHLTLSLNMQHIGNLGEMITQGDYNYQVNELFEFLDERGN